MAIVKYFFSIIYLEIFSFRFLFSRILEERVQKVTHSTCNWNAFVKIWNHEGEKNIIIKMLCNKSTVTELTTVMTILVSDFCGILRLMLIVIYDDLWSAQHPFLWLQQVEEARVIPQKRMLCAP